MEDHKHQSFWQIYFPMILFVIIALAVGIFLIIQTSPSPAYLTSLKLANISLIFMVLVAVFPILLFLIILCAVIYGLAKLITITPLYSKIAQGYVFLAATKIIQVTDSIIKPFLYVRSKYAGAMKGLLIIKETFQKKHHRES